MNETVGGVFYKWDPLASSGASESRAGPGHLDSAYPSWSVGSERLLLLLIVRLMVRVHGGSLTRCQQVHSGTREFPQHECPSRPFGAV
jgi:hypothetical protein